MPNFGKSKMEEKTSNLLGVAPDGRSKKPGKSKASCTAKTNGSVLQLNAAIISLDAGHIQRFVRMLPEISS